MLAENVVLMSSGCKHTTCSCWERQEQWIDWGSSWHSTRSCTIISCSSYRYCVW